MLGGSYYIGDGVPVSTPEAAAWLARSANQGLAVAQNFLGTLYYLGEGVPFDHVLAYAWLNLAAARLAPSDVREVAANLRDDVRERMTSAELAEAQQITRAWQPGTGDSDGAKAAEDADQGVVSSGTGFAVHRDGYVLTNQHVIDGCTTIRVTLGQATEQGVVVRADTRNDLALLKVPNRSEAVATFRGGTQGIRPGDDVVVVGFPLHGPLASDPTVTTGTVSVLAGPGDDSRLLQMSAPVQPGNSGGPLLDASGNVVGVVVSKLGLEVALATGDIPQNVNFAIRGDVARLFLNRAGIEARRAPSAVELRPADVAERAGDFTALIECLG